VFGGMLNLILLLLRRAW